MNTLHIFISEKKTGWGSEIIYERFVFCTLHLLDTDYVWLGKKYFDSGSFFSLLAVILVTGFFNGFGLHLFKNFKQKIKKQWIYPQGIYILFVYICVSSLVFVQYALVKYLGRYAIIYDVKFYIFSAHYSQPINYVLKTENGLLLIYHLHLSLTCSWCDFVRLIRCISPSPIIELQERCISMYVFIWWLI